VGSRWLPAQPLTDGKFVAAKVHTQGSSQLKYFSSERLTISRNSCMLSLRLHLLFSQCELACILWDLPEKKLTCKNSKTKGLGFTKLSQHKLSTMMPMNTTWQESLVPQHKPWMLAKA